jgi:hypothetical protein
MQCQVVHRKKIATVHEKWELDSEIDYFDSILAKLLTNLPRAVD